jgi:hypothetical protein
MKFEKRLGAHEFELLQLAQFKGFTFGEQFN